MFRLTHWAVIGLVALAACMPSREPRAEAQSARQGVSIEDARSLPLERRLDLYQEIYNRPGHPSDSSLSMAFDAEGVEAFGAAVRRMSSKQSFYGMIWIVKAIDRGGGVDACAPPAADALRERIRALGLSSDDLSYIDFRRCALQSLA